MTKYTLYLKKNLLKIWLINAIHFTDWSSILFDFIYTNKPAYILKKTFHFYEPNPIFKDIENFRISKYSDIKEVLNLPYDNAFKINYNDLRQKIFNNDLVNKGNQNYLNNINRLINMVIKETNQPNILFVKT